MKTSYYQSIREQHQEIINDFTDYLKTQRFATDTIRSEINYTASFLSWAKQQQNQVMEVTYNDLLVFIEYCTHEGDSKILINRKLSAIRKYYDYLQYKGEAVKNPATGLFIKHKHQRVPSNLLSYEELICIYDNYQITDLRSQRNKVIIGLLVFQALRREEIETLDVMHVKLTSCKIEIPAGKHCNGRILLLESVQMLDLSEYITITRNSILKAQGKYGTGRKPKDLNEKKIQGQLFISMHGSENMKNSFLHLFHSLRRLNPKITNAQQIRQSVITQWLKTKPLRTVQYMAGHRWVSSTERYEVHSLNDLYNQLEKLHPLNDNRNTS